VEWYGREMQYDNGRWLWGCSDIWNHKLLHKATQLPKEEINNPTQFPYLVSFLQCGICLIYLCWFMANQTPVICSNQTGSSELIQDGINGYLMLMMKMSFLKKIRYICLCLHNLIGAFGSSPFLRTWGW